MPVKLRYFLSGECSSFGPALTLRPPTRALRPATGAPPTAAHASGDRGQCSASNNTQGHAWRRRRGANVPPLVAGSTVPRTAAISFSSARAPATCAPIACKRAQSRVGGVDQCRRPIWECTHQLYDAIIRTIPATMPGVNHGKVLWRRFRATRPRPIEHDRPYALTVARKQGDLGDDSSRGPGTVAPPAVRT